MLSLPCVCLASSEDTVHFKLEVGAASDLTNEQFYEDAFVDSVALGRRIVSSPESRVTGLLYASLTGIRSGRAVQYQVQNELTLGSKTKRDVFWGTWRSELSPKWRLDLFPRIEYRHDLTFDRDLREWRGSATARLQRSFMDRTTRAEVGAGGEYLRSSGEGAHFLLDRNAGRASVALERAPLLGPEWRLGYALTVRAFPDSSERDHLEHGWEARWRSAFTGTQSIEFEMDGGRRTTRKVAPTSRDNFWQGNGAVVAELRMSESTALRSRLGAEAIKYDREDTTLFFDYQILRAQVAPRFQRDRWTLSLGPRAEALFSRGDPSEEYREIGGVFELEYMSGGTWWSITPASGWRDYSDASVEDALAGTLYAPSLHSSFAFLEIGVLGQQPIPGAMRLRVFASARAEWHVESTEDARSLYFSVDVRRLF